MQNPNTKLDTDNPLLSVQQVAEIFGCSRRTVGRFELKGLRSEILVGGSIKRFYLKEVRRFARVHFVRATVVTTEKKKEAKNARMQSRIQAAG